MQFGRYYEEFEVGAVYKHWPGKTVTEYDDHLFCLITMNHHPLHLDSHFAEETTDFGKNVVVGNYIYSLLLGMSVADVSGKAIANLEVESLRHVKPTFHGDTIYGETMVLDKTPSKSKDDRGVVYVETKGYKQDGTVVCIFRRKVMVPKQSYGDTRGGEQPGRPSPPPDQEQLATPVAERGSGRGHEQHRGTRDGDPGSRGQRVGGLRLDRPPLGVLADGADGPQRHGEQCGGDGGRDEHGQRRRGHPSPPRRQRRRCTAQHHRRHAQDERSDGVLGGPCRDRRRRRGRCRATAGRSPRAPRACPPPRRDPRVPACPAR